MAHSMQLIAGRTAQEYNQRKNRQGAFWEDLYHATAIETGEHLDRAWSTSIKTMLTQVRSEARLRSRWLNYRQGKVLSDSREIRVIMKQRNILFNRQGGNQAIDRALDR